jgi:hypothetical protein
MGEAVTRRRREVRASSTWCSSMYGCSERVCPHVRLDGWRRDVHAPRHQHEGTLQRPSRTRPVDCKQAPQRSAGSRDSPHHSNAPSQPVWCRRHGVLARTQRLFQQEPTRWRVARTGWKPCGADNGGPSPSRHVGSREVALPRHFAFLTTSRRHLVRQDPGRTHRRPLDSQHRQATARHVSDPHD